MPATAEEESHPGELLAGISVGPADPQGIGWQQTGEYMYKINLDPDSWFTQEEGNIYWIAIQGIIDPVYYSDNFRWIFRDIDSGTWGDDAAYASDSEGYDPWWHWGWVHSLNLDLYQGTLPEDWLQSADMAFRLSGIPIPEPATILLAGLGLLALIRRRKQG